MPDDPNEFRFTEARIRDLPPAAKGTRLRYRDEAQPGLCLRVTEAGAKTFKLYRKVAGRVVDLTLGTSPALSVEAARKLAAKHLVDLAGGVDVQAAKRSIREEMTLGDLFSDFIEYHAKPRKRTWEIDQRRFELYCSGLKARPIGKLMPVDVQNWHSRIGRDHGQVAANRAHSMLRKVFNFARQRGWRGDNPAVGVDRFTERTRERFLSADELRCFFAALAAEEDRTPRDFFLLALLTGARRANVLGMRWEDIDLARGLWRIPGEKSKSGEALVVILAPHVVSLLTERRELVTDSPWVLPTPNAKSGHYSEPKKAWGRILARAELWRLVAMIGAKEGLEAAGIEAAQAAATAEVLQVQYDAFCRKFPRGTDCMEVVTDRYRERAKALKLEPDQAKMMDLHIHDLRRTLGSWQAAMGSSLPIIGRSLGHRQMQTTMIYARLSLDPVRESVEKATAAMMTAGNLPFHVEEKQ